MSFAVGRPVALLMEISEHYLKKCSKLSLPDKLLLLARETGMPLYQRASVDGGISYSFAASA